MGGVYREIVRPERLVHTEKFDETWYPGESLITTVLDEKNGKTTLTATMLYESREARDGVLKSPMEQGVKGSTTSLPRCWRRWFPVRYRRSQGRSGKWTSVMDQASNAD